MGSGAIAGPGRAADTSPHAPEETASRIARCAWTGSEQAIGRSFERQVRMGPERIAVAGPQETLTYAALNRRANRCARALAERTDDAPRPVAVLLPKDGALFAALLGAVKVGRPYVLLDPAHPAPRLARMLEDSAATTIVADEKTASLARTLTHATTRAPRVLPVEAIDAAGHGEADLETAPAGDALAYLVYTSGSTGAPKGVVQLHRNVLHYAQRQVDVLDLVPQDRLTLLASPGTGQAATDIFASLLSGASVHPVDVREVGFDHLARWLRRHRITVFHSSASVFRSLLDALEDGETFPDVRVVKLGSEPVFRRDVEGWRRHFNASCTFVNALSSSEAGLVRHMTIAHGARPDDDVAVPVGYPVDGAEVLLLDERGQPVGIGEAGEIVLRSQYLSPGYWGDPARSAAAFRPDPGGAPARLFSTGDRGRLLADGRLTYLGRADNQVKIRGFRVECADVQAAIQQDGDVLEAVVRPHREHEGTATLVAYMVPRRGIALTPRAVAARLRARVPDYMIPTTIVMMEALPLSSGGKVDLQALPSPAGAREVARDAGRSASARPRTLLERQLATVWEEILGVHPIGVHDDFFDLGGHSLLAIQMVDRVERLCGARPPLSSLMRGATIEQLAAAVLARDPHPIESPLVVLNPGGQLRPLVFLHGNVNGGGFYCRRLAERLGADRPVAVIAPHGHDGRPIPSTIEAMAADRLRVLAAFQPRGPYLLGGYCNGGLVAYEMARQLERQGESVALVALIDVSALNARFAWLWRAVVAGSTILRRDHETQARWFGALRAAAIELRNRPGRVPAAGLAAVRRRLGRATKGATPAPERLGAAVVHAREDARAFDQIYYESVSVYREIIARYVPAPYAGRVVLLHSTTTVDRAAGDPTAGWRRVLRQAELHPIPGDHQTCLTDHLDALAARLIPALECADARAREPRSV